jgi:iron complex outermembrane recepter protein
LKTKILTALLMLLCMQYAHAQNKTTTLKVYLQAAVKTDSVNNTTIALYILPEDSLIASQVFKKEGNTFSVNQFSKYIIKASCIGFETVVKTINITDKPVTAPLLLKRSSTNLQIVTVVSKKPLIKQEDDKTIVDAAVLANSSTNAYEVLEKTPGAIVDQDGNVYLSSTSPATVFINGREMKLSSADLASLLKSLPAGSVSKIEILRNPSAKYDAASSGGIVNIVLKKGVKLGSSGSVNVGYFQGVYSTQTAGLNINKSAGKLNSYFSYQFTNRNNFEELNSDRLISKDSALLIQKAYTTYPSINNYFGGGVDYAFTKKFNIAYDLRFSNTNGKSNASNAIEIAKNFTPLVLGKNQSDITNKNNSLFIGNNISSKYKIDSAGSEWTVEFDYNYYKNNNTQFYNNYSFLPVRPTVLGDGETKGVKNIFVAQTDLTLKLPKKFTVETGFKATISNSNNSAAYFYDTSNSGRKVDPFQTNTFKYKETISAAYVQVSKTFFGFTLKPGLRLETTDINGRQTIPKDTSLAIKRTDVFPYVFLRHKLFKIFGFPLIGSAIYRRSIKRPYYETLNPYPKYIDQYLFDVGNPNLKPQFTTNYEVNVTFNDFPVLALGVNETKDIFTNVTYQDDITKIAYRTYDNLGKNKELYFRLVGGIPPGGKYFFYAGAQHNFNGYKGFYQNQPLNYTRGSWLFFMYHELKATKTLTIDVQGFMRTRALQNFYELDNFGGLYISANKSVLKRKGNIIFSINDLFRTNPVTFHLNQGNVKANGVRANDSRRFGITFRYNFGLSKPKENSSFGAPVDSKEN